MNEYKITTQKSWSTTQNDLAREFEAWGVKEWATDYPKGARMEGFNQDIITRTVNLTYVKNGRTVTLSMGKQARALENLRVLYIAINAIRMNERRGIGELMSSVYLQLEEGASHEKSPYEKLGLQEGLPLSVYEAMYKDLAKFAHPDAGGSEWEMTELNGAINKIRNQLNKS